MTIDLFAWPEVHAAELAVSRAHADWKAAQRRAWLAPHGMRQARQAELAATARRVLEAEIYLVRVRREAKGR